MKSKVTAKSTKNEILDAYNQLIQDQEKNITRDRLKTKEELDQKQKVETATKSDKKGIIHKIAELKIDINGALDGLSKNLVEEKSKFDELQEAIKIESARLKELYEIKENAKTLEALLLAQKHQKEEFEQEMQEKKEQLENAIEQTREKWQKEQQEHHNHKQEQVKLGKLAKEREEEEYKYQIKIRNQKDKDEYEQKKILLERSLEEKKKQLDEDIAKRLENIKAQEDEMKELREIKKNYDAEIQSAIKSTKETLQKELEIKYKYEAELKARDSKSTIELLKQNVQSLQDKLQDKERAIITLQKQVETAHLQSQELAKKVVESSSIKNIIPITQETQKKES